MGYHDAAKKPHEDINNQCPPPPKVLITNQDTIPPKLIKGLVSLLGFLKSYG